MPNQRWRMPILWFIWILNAFLWRILIAFFEARFWRQAKGKMTENRKGLWTLRRKNSVPCMNYLWHLKHFVFAAVHLETEAICVIDLKSNFMKSCTIFLTRSRKYIPHSPMLNSFIESKNTCEYFTCLHMQQHSRVDSTEWYCSCARSCKFSFTGS